LSRPMMVGECLVRTVCRGCGTTVFVPFDQIQQAVARCGFCQTGLFISTEVADEVIQAINDFNAQAMLPPTSHGDESGPELIGALVAKLLEGGNNDE